MRIVKKNDKTINISEVNPEIHFIVKETNTLWVLVELDAGEFVWRHAHSLTNAQNEKTFSEKDLKTEINTSEENTKYYAFEKPYDFYLFVQRTLM